MRQRNTAQVLQNRLSQGFTWVECCSIFRFMSIKCFFGVHRPSLGSIIRRDGRYRAICECCARPLERHESGRWQASEPLDVAQRAA